MPGAIESTCRDRRQARPCPTSLDCASRTPSARTDTFGPKSVHVRLARERMLSIMRDVEGLLEACHRGPILRSGRGRCRRPHGIGQELLADGLTFGFPPFAGLGQLAVAGGEDLGLAAIELVLGREVC